MSVKHFQEADLAVAQRGAVGSFDLAGALRIDKRLRSLRPRQQDAALLEGLADRRDPETERVLVEPLAARVKRGLGNDLLVALVDAAAGKHQRAGIEVDLIMADHHEDFDFFVCRQRPAGAGWWMRDAG